MSPLNHYKKLENQVVDDLGKQARTLGNVISSFFRRVMVLGKQRFTVMFIPHSEKKIFNFRISVFSLVFIGVLLAGILFTFFLFSTNYSGMSRLLSSRSQNLSQTQASLEVLRDQINDLNKVSRVFETTLGKTMGTLGLDTKNTNTNTAGGDLASLNKVSEQNQGMLQEESELQNLTDLMNRSVGSLAKITSLFQSHSKLLVELPTMWPVQGGVGRVTTYFGPAIHPFTHQMYLHMGVDIAYRPGVPIVAAADGKVVEKRYEALGFGNYVVIRHRYGFYTKYAHMEQVYVHEGDEVKQGQMIGRMGSTGLSTGPHLHFEIRLGSEVVDPMRYLDINRESQAIPVSQD